MMKNTTRNNNQEVKGHFLKVFLNKFLNEIAITYEIVLIISICNLLLLIITF